MLGLSRSLRIIGAIVVMITGMIVVRPVRAMPACQNNALYPRVPQDMCSEILIVYPYVPGLASITALTFGPDDSLYFARPATSEIVRVKPDANGLLDGLHQAPQVFASHLPEPPNGLIYYDGAFYVSGDTTITRLRDTTGSGVADEQRVIVRDLPGGVGGWLGNIRVGPDKRLYVAKGASCDACIETDPRRAALLSFALDGSDPRIVAQLLHDSYDFGWNPRSNALYIVDNEGITVPGELKMISSTGAVKSVATFEPGSHPSGMAFYEKDAFPAYKRKLLVTLAGSWNADKPIGYALALVGFDSNNMPNSVSTAMPTGYADRGTLADASLYRLSFYPDHPIGIAISAEGWIYISVREGHIYRFRPRP